MAGTRRGVLCAYLAEPCNTGRRALRKAAPRRSFYARVSAIKSGSKPTDCGITMDASADKQATTGDAEHHPRVEDDALVRGLGRYIADAPEPNQAFAYFVRSPHAFARIVNVDPDAAPTARGVIAVLTAQDMEGVGNISRHPPLPGRSAAKLIVSNRPPLARDRVMHVGEAVVMVIAESALAAQDAAEFVTVDYEPLTPVTDARAALQPGAPLLWPEAPSNLAIDWPGPAADPDANAAEVERIFASAKFVARISEMNQRLCVASMEPRGGTASYDAARDTYTLRTCSQSAGTMRENILGIMNWPKEKLRVITEDVGGAFGLKTSAYPEYIALLVAAKKIGRPVHWMSGRSEAFLSDNQARDTYSKVELALDDKGKFLALRIRSVGNMGAYLGAIGANIPTISFTRCLPGMYDIKPIDISVKCVYTNTLPTAPYRGAGRPEASYALERVVDEAARITGIDPIKLRRRNLIKKSAMPYKTAVGTVIDSGDFAPMLDKALELADYANFKRRRREAHKRGKYRGLGVCCMLEHSGGSPTESALLAFAGGSNLQFRLNVQNTGQGHATVFSRFIAGELGDDGRPFGGKSDRGDARQGEAARRRNAGSRRGGYRLQERRVRGGRHRSSRVALRCRGGGRGAQKARRDRRRSRHQSGHRDAADLPQRRAHRRGRDRSGDWRNQGRQLCRRRRLRPAARPNDRGGPVARRHRLGPWPGADGECGLRRRQRPARDWLVYGLRHAARRGHAAVARCHAQCAGDHQSARTQGRRRRDRKSTRL